MQYTPVECGGTAAGGADAAGANLHPGEGDMELGGTQYSSLVSNANPAAPSAEGSSEYMAMSPPNATPTTTRWDYN